MTSRYALYLVPPEDHPLYRLGQHLVGRDSHYGGPLPQPVLDDVDPQWLAKITTSPRHYGFHGTLKPPFHLAEGESAEALHETVEKFAANQSAFTVPVFEIRVLDGFIGIVPATRSDALHSLADSCVRDFDHFRAPAQSAETQKRRARSLTPAHDVLLERWGYPYVLEEFRPHFSLTERIEEADKRETTLSAIKASLPSEALSDVPFDSICIFGQPNEWMPFYETMRFPFAD
ncbi:MAG: DUF1045 domain-containing protein [Proteobacteria bacterium]|nr:DUF1045 domain-containing protein [Pseudomonadota bacterium]